jgi:hypothetical protein
MRLCDSLELSIRMQLHTFQMRKSSSVVPDRAIDICVASLTTDMILKLDKEWPELRIRMVVSYFLAPLLVAIKRRAATQIVHRDAVFASNVHYRVKCRSDLL